MQLVIKGNSLLTDSTLSIYVLLVFLESAYTVIVVICFSK